MTLNVDFKDEQDIYEIRIAMKAVIRKAIFNTLIYEGVDDDVEVSVTFTNNDKIRELNNQYRNLDSSTDVLSFPLFDRNASNIGTIPLGDIVISLERAKKQAHDFYHSSYHELAFLAIHSTLHLLGYDHETSKEDEEDMFRRQKEIMEIIDFNEKNSFYINSRQTKCWKKHIAKCHIGGKSGNSIFKATNYKKQDNRNIYEG